MDNIHTIRSPFLTYYEDRFPLYAFRNDISLLNALRGLVNSVLDDVGPFKPIAVVLGVNAFHEAGVDSCRKVISILPKERIKDKGNNCKIIVRKHSVRTTGIARPQAWSIHNMLEPTAVVETSLEQELSLNILVLAVSPDDC